MPKFLLIISAFVLLTFMTFCTLEVTTPGGYTIDSGVEPLSSGNSSSDSGNSAVWLTLTYDRQRADDHEWVRKLESKLRKHSKGLTAGNQSPAGPQCQLVVTQKDFTLSGPKLYFSTRNCTNNVVTFTSPEVLKAVRNEILCHANHLEVWRKLYLIINLILILLSCAILLTGLIENCSP